MSHSGHSVVEDFNTYKETGAGQIDPCRFRFIESLIERASNAHEPVQNQVLEKARAALQEYQGHVHAQQEAIRGQLDGFLKRCPQYRDAAEVLFEQHQFVKLRKLILNEQVANDQKRYRALAGLLVEAESDEPEQQQLSFDELLMAHENEVVQSFAQGAEQWQPESSQFSDLKSHRLFKDTWVKIHAERIVSDAIKQLPSHAGPLNSQRLAIQSLEAMRELSPEYLNRFVSYMDSMLWLEQAVQSIEAEAKNTKTKNAKTKRKQKK